RPGWWYLAAAAVGFGVLTKGPVPFLLIIPPAWLYTRLNGAALRAPLHNAFASRLTRAAGFLAVVAAINLPWYTAIYLLQPVCLRYFFWEHNVLRFVQPFDHLQPIWYYAPIVLVGMVPGIFLAFAFLRHLGSGDPERSRTRTPALGFCLLAGLWCVLFFSL